MISKGVGNRAKGTRRAGLHLDHDSIMSSSIATPFGSLRSNFTARAIAAEPDVILQHACESHDPPSVALGDSSQLIAGTYCQSHPNWLGESVLP